MKQNIKEKILNELFGFRCIKCKHLLDKAVEKGVVFKLKTNVPCFNCWENYCSTFRCKYNFEARQDLEWFKDWECVKKGRCLLE